MVVIGILSSVWAILVFMAILAAKFMNKEFCTGNAERIQNGLDAFCSFLNCLAFLWTSIELNSSQPDQNQGDSTLAMMEPIDAEKMKMGIAMSFLLFVLYAGSLGINFKLYTPAEE